MIKDLSKEHYSATSVFMRLLPTIEEIGTENLSTNEKIHKVDLLVSGELSKAMLTAVNEEGKSQISRDYIIKVRKTIQRQSSISQVIKYINNAIEAGKHYNTEQGE